MCAPWTMWRASGYPKTGMCAPWTLGRASGHSGTGRMCAPWSVWRLRPSPSLEQLNQSSVLKQGGVRHRGATPTISGIRICREFEKIQRCAHTATSACRMKCSAAIIICQHTRTQHYTCLADTDIQHYTCLADIAGVKGEAPAALALHPATSHV